MIFLPGQARLVTLTEDNHLHLWEINGTTLQACLSLHIHISPLDYVRNHVKLGVLSKGTVLCGGCWLWAW